MHFDPTWLLILPALVLSVVVHECAHGVVALWNGDPTAQERGRLTLNPIRHVDPIGSLVLPAALLLLRAPFVIGWARPIPVDWARLRHPVNDAVKVALAGPASNLMLAVAFGALARLAPADGFFAPLAIAGRAGVVINCGLALFNMIPIPPLDGSWVLMRFLPLRHIIVLQRFRLAGLVLVMLLMSAPGVSNVVLFTPLRWMVRGVFGLFGVSDAGSGL